MHLSPFCGRAVGTDVAAYLRENRQKSERRKRHTELSFLALRLPPQPTGASLRYGLADHRVLHRHAGAAGARSRRDCRYGVLF